MKKYISMFFIGTFLSGFPLVSSQSPSEENRTGQPGRFTSVLINTYHRLTSSPEIEKRRFPLIDIPYLLELLGDAEKEGIQNTLTGREFPYEMGSREGAADFYKGIATIEDFDFGKCRGLPESDGGVSQTFNYTTLVDKANLRNFLDEWNKNSDNQKELSKGKPYKGDDTKTRVKYIIRNRDANQYIKFTIRRERRV